MKSTMKYAFSPIPLTFGNKGVIIDEYLRGDCSKCVRFG